MVDFVAYIDESGDPGIKELKPGGSQWFVLSCLLVRTQHIATLGNTHERILSQFKNRQTNYLHFKNLLPFKKLIACQDLAATPCRTFSIISDKRNLVNYKNPNLPGGRAWFYWWMSRILLEKVTDFCHRKSKIFDIQNPKIRIVFSRRSANNYDEFKSYLAKIKIQSATGNLYITEDDITWPVIDPKEIHIVDAKNLVGLQLVDIVAGATYNGLETGTKQHTHEYISRLLPVFAKDRDRKLYGYGIKCMPYLGKLTLNDKQKEFFRLCEYDGRWAPGP